MISYLKGKILVLQPASKKDGFLFLENGGIGYQIYCPASLLNKMKVGAEAELYIYHSVREDAEDLFGLASFEDLEFFKLLLSVSGIGPKSAMSILSAASPEQIRQAVVSNQPDLLHKLCGLGQKTAQKVVDGLKDKFSGEFSFGNEGYGDDYSQALDGLLALGYNLFDARKALEQTKADADVAVRVKEALKYLGKGKK